MTKQELYKMYSDSPVYLNEELHVYVHKKTGKIYNSMTGALKLISEEFDEERMIPAIIKQHQNFLDWFYKIGASTEHLLDACRLYRTYQKDRPFKMVNKRDGDSFKAYKKIGDYKSLQEFYDEFNQLKLTNPKVNNKVYLNYDFSVMNYDQIKEQWIWLNNIANHYGHIIHLSIEDRFLDIQKLVTLEGRLKKLAEIQEKFDKLQELYAKITPIFNQEHFDIYKIDGTALEFRDFIETCYDKVDLDYGLISVPENLMFSEYYDICGTSDQKNIITPSEFVINDYKTNKEFTFSSEYGNFLKKPFDHLEHCQFNDYSIQLNGYALIEQMNYNRKCIDRNVIYWNRVDSRFDLIKIPQMLSEAESLLKLHKNTQDELIRKYTASGILTTVDERYHIYISKFLENDIKQKQNNGFFEEMSKLDARKYYKDEINKQIFNLNQKLAA